MSGNFLNPKFFLKTCLLLSLLSIFTACPSIDRHPDLKVKDLRMGTGAEVDRWSEITVLYKGSFLDGTVFDENKGKPKTYVMRSSTLIDGWKVGLLGMKAGGKRRLTIPPEMAFGKKGKLGRIPADATLVFEIELLTVH